MKWRVIAVLGAGLAVASCGSGGNPFGNAPQCGGNPLAGTPCPDPTPPDPTPTPPEDGPGGLPGTETPSAATPIIRYEDVSDDTGNGYAQGFTFNAADNTYTVDNLAFDGGNDYRKRLGQPVDRLGGYEVYEAAAEVRDPQTGALIPQFEHKLLAGVSRSGRTEFAIVRTGAYRGYGFGGFVMKRNDNFVRPPNPPSGANQAAYSGNYAAVRDFDGASGLEYATGAMTIAIDFNDFNRGDAVKGTVSNRQIFDANGTNITARVLEAMDAKFDRDDKAPATRELPTLVFAVGPGAINANGEIGGLLDSSVIDYNGDRARVVTYEAGKYYGVVSGPNADEVVGVIVIEAEDPRIDGVTVRETGGFILYRP
ncbi:hypothetical protein [Pseudotabrizicola algicola]|uniref:Uncharacterized protein n=1 Tax=Pseudotabrizicola algicola TaxID=2709381 RepID=A0A6B3RSN8_9RHOB|nr:hypothetical protein [Pseudotabrizicola algicola]NEX47768.1 hypothetical protein [Pseudotabrizicola algicola]